uniref:Uncharacterized protein n=1 Tax=Anguilla anguilla TaxID=7936 RepID=A0A0E9SKL1_ANGAN
MRAHGGYSKMACLRRAFKKKHFSKAPNPFHEHKVLQSQLLAFTRRSITSTQSSKDQIKWARLQAQLSDKVRGSTAK